MAEWFHGPVVDGELIATRIADPLARLPALAERLGVAPTTDNVGILLRMQDGRQYSVFALVNALLDRIDRMERG